jgi:hypothetical protein
MDSSPEHEAEELTLTPAAIEPVDELGRQDQIDALPAG